MKIRKIALFLLLAFLVVGCATPKAVKQLSQETIKVNAQYHESLSAYFDVILAFVESQVELSKIQLEASYKITEKGQKKRAEIRLRKADSAAINGILSDYEKAIKKTTSERETDINNLNKLIEQLNSKNKELLAIQEVIIAAQMKLDDYVQLEKADEAILNELMGVVSGQMGKLTETMGEVTGIYGEITGLIKK